MVGLPTYQPDQVRTEEFRGVNPNPDAFGASVAEAAAGFGQQVQRLGASMKEVEDKNAASNVMDAYTQGTSRLRDTLYDPQKGLLNRKGAQAIGVRAEAEKTSQTIFTELSARLQTPEEKRAFQQMWSRKEESVADSTAQFEFGQAAAARQEGKVSALSNLQSDVVANYRDAKSIAGSIDAARAMIRSNPDGLSAEGVAAMERKSISSLQTSVVQRLAQDNPGDALDYYEAHKGDFDGSDHATVQGYIKSVSIQRQAKSAAGEIAGAGPASQIVRAVRQAESGGNPAAQGFRPNSKGQFASGEMQLMPDTAREVAARIGMQDVATMDDAQLQEFWKTPKGQAANVAIGSTYLNQQLQKYGGDLEAAIVAYNAGPGNADKFLNSGRDYKSLPMPDETYKYVGNVMGAYLGIDMSGKKVDDGSAGYQTIAQPGPAGQRFRGGNPGAFLMQKLQPGKPAEYVDNMQPMLKDGLAALMNDAPDFVKDGLDLLSGARSVERQQQLWNEKLRETGGDVAAARKWVAPPGKSQHNHGNAADLGWKGGRYASAPPEVKAWVAANAERYGLTFPMGHEPWHIETIDARSKGGRVNRGANVSERIDAGEPENQDGQFVDAGRSFVPDGMPVAFNGAPPSAADIYTAATGPFSIKQEKANLQDWLEDARDRYSDNPPLLAEVERQLNEKYQATVAEQANAQDVLQKQVFAEIVRGGKVEDQDPSVLQQLGAEQVDKLMNVQAKYAGRDDKTDDETYYKLSRMSPEELRDINLLDYVDKLSKADFKKWADDQGKVTRGATAASSSAGMRTRNQLVDGVAATLGIETKAGSDGAKRIAALDRALDEKIAAYVAEKATDPGSTEIQKMLDELVISGRVSKDWASDPTKMVFELTPEERANFYTIDSYSQFEELPEDKKAAVASGYKAINGFAPNEDGAVEFYNDLSRVALGAAPTPPKNLAPTIKQKFAQKYGRAPTEEEAAAIYKRLIEKSTGVK